MKIWCYFGPEGRVCADTDFKTPEEAWRVMLGWPTRGEVAEAKKRGDQVIAIDIRLPDSDAKLRDVLQEFSDAFLAYGQTQADYEALTEFDRLLRADRAARAVLKDHFADADKMIEGAPLTYSAPYPGSDDVGTGPHHDERQAHRDSRALADAQHSECDRLRAELERLRGIKPELPPRPPDGQGLPRYGLRWNFVGEPASVPFADGYWTPWHLAQAQIDRLRVALEEIAVGRIPDDLAGEQHADLLTASRLCGIARTALTDVQHPDPEYQPIEAERQEKP